MTLGNVLLLFVSMMAAAAIASPTTFSSMSYVANLRVHPFEEMPLPQYSVLDGATVSIEYGFNPGFDQLLLDYTGDFPISAVFSKQTGILYLSGTAPISEYSAAIQSVVFVTSASDGANRVITFTYGQNTTYATSTEHFYRFVQGNSAPWSQAADDCVSRSYMGMQGYLATITSDREMTEVIGRSTAKTWLGAAPNASGAWYWITGPEGQENRGKGRVFWVGEDLYAGGVPANDFTFDNWYAFNPVNGNNATYGIGMPPTYENVAYMAVAGPDDGIQAWVCEFGGMDSAAIAATTWSYTGSMTLQFDCSLFATLTDCSDHSTQGCAWSSGSCQTSDCSRYLLQSNCAADWRCDWYVNGEVGLCANTECAQYANQATCTADPNCFYKNMQCLVATCRNLPACQCTSMTGCTPVGRLCFSDASIGCSNMDIVYLVDGTMNMSQAFERYPNGFVGVTQAIANADLSMTSTAAASAATSGNKGSRVGIVMFSSTTPITSPASIGSAGRLTGLNSELLADVQYLQRTFTASATSRKVGPALLTALNMLKTSTTRQRVIVVISSAFISDAATIAGDTTSTGILAQLQQASTTVLGVTLRPTEPETPDSMASEQSLAMITSKTISTTMTYFNDQVVYGICSNNALTLGALLPVKSIPICSMHVAQMDCVKDATCSWDNAARACSPTACLSICTSSTCNAQSNCAWDVGSGLCFQTCGSVTTSQACALKSQACQWDSSNAYCAPNPCTSNPSEDSCIADSYGCVFTGGLCTIPQCLASDIASCVSSTATGGVCTFSSTGTCFFSPCQTTNSTRCSLHPECWWSAGKCALNPCGQRYQSEMTCQSDRNCAWNTTVSPAVCSLAPCSGLNFNADPQGSCRMDPTCYWQPKAENGYQDMCVVKPCYANPRSCDCAAQDGCVWTNNTCKDSTFVQCSPMDVVFLVEATTSMTEPFGRHPNGFSGIIEAIRSWGASVPMSPLSSSTGFRLAIVGYGSATRSLQPADGSPLFGSNFTNNATLWSGPNLILDNFANNQPAYGEISGSDVSIFYGLRAAATLFENANAPNRQKILMVFGHAAITDGDNAAVVEIMQTLQNNNVQVFTNVVRRFSVITPAEETAAAYLRPLASDPVQSHYSFSTIDDLQSSILESFCDPSTTIGEALGISRDGTLPCDWLTGSDECNVQGSCYWNTTAFPTCPLSGQCPNLGCVALPAALAAQFECKHCTYSGGSFSCDRSQNYAAAAGVCLKTPCSANCATGTCAGSCEWDSSSLRCQRSMCHTTNVTLCNADPGCVWLSSTGLCTRSVCGSTRTSAGCQGITSDGFTPICTWTTTTSPAVCVQQRCPNMNRATCSMFPAQCTYDTVADSCVEKLCQYTDAELCSSDSGCYWNPYERIDGQFGSCKPRQRGCVVSDFSSYSPCTANCGSNSVKVRSRAIVQFPAVGGTSCAQAAVTLGLQTSTPGVMAQSTSCTNASGWSASCPTYCAQYGNSVTRCINDISCQWVTGCVPRNVSGCASLSTQAACSASDMCSWDTTLLFCEDAPQACRFSTNAQCSVISGCTWRTGANSNLLASSLTLESYLVNPGQDPIHPFPTLSINSNEVVNGAAVTIENGYQLGKDVLTMTYPTSIATTWVPQSGMLRFFGAASASEYGFVIRAVKFQTSSLASGARNITWNLGNGTLFSLSTGHYYRYTPRTGLSWDAAAQLCSGSSFYGMTGYLATVMSGPENNLVSTKLSGTGWLGGSSDGNAWTWSGGPEAGTAFWYGSSLAQGGAAVPNMYANWDSLSGEPQVLSNATTRTRTYLSPNGYWDAMDSAATGVEGYTCEYGGLPSDSSIANFTLSGAVVIGIAGCLPQTQCSFHATQSLCLADSACTWSGYSCVVGCGTRSTATECGQNTQCAWNVTILPPLCDLDPCKSYQSDACGTQTQCKWNGTLCVLKTGCGQYSRELCNNFAACQYVNETCIPKRCPSITSSSACAAVPTCTYSTFTGCTSACRYSSTDDCTADPTCQWASGTTVATPFYSGGSPMFPFTTGTQSPSTNNGYIDGITVRISAGFQQGMDVLSVASTNKNRYSYIASYSSLSGVLQLVVSAGSMISPLQAYAFLTTAVQFSTTGSTLVTRKLSYVLSIRAASVNNTVFKVLSTRGIKTRADASAACNATTLFGLRGRLAVVDKQTVNVALNQIGAQGIIAATSTGNGQWFWPGSALPFWNGNGATGVAVNNGFAAWPFQEPQEDMTTASIGPGGMWFSSIPSQQTYSAVCSFGADPSEVFSGGAVFGAVILTPQGCFPQPCAGLSSTTCELQNGCQWSVTTQTCTKESWCSVNTDSSVCGTLSGCYWDYTASACKRLPTDSCQPITNPALCATVTGCAWSTSLQQANRSWGACRRTGCTLFPTQSSCSSDSTCRWYTPLSSTTSICVNRLCGYTTATDCRSDVNCAWQSSLTAKGTFSCQVSPCNVISAAACSSTAGCMYDSTSAMCVSRPCSATTMTTCLADPSCLFQNNQCSQPACSGTTVETCDPSKCYFTYDPPTCTAAQCFSYQDESDCEPAGQNSLCRWGTDASACRQATWLELNSPNGTIVDTCVQQQEPNLTWLYIVLVIIFILIALIAYRLFLAFARGLNFLSSTRNNQRFKVHKKYASELFDESRERADRDDYRNPAMSDL